LAALERLSKLEYLGLDATPLTDAGLPYIAKLRSVKKLFLSSTRIKGHALAELDALCDLETLHVVHTAIDDEALTSLGGMQRLTYLGTKSCPGVTHSAVEGLRQALPYCTIACDWGVFHRRSRLEQYHAAGSPLVRDRGTNRGNN
jgi:hypothetical protein